jgi:flagellar hook-associated protein 3 FlgL
MRIGMNTKFGGILADLERLSSEITLNQLKISSGKNFLKPSDDPAASVTTLNYKQGISRLERYMRAIDDGYAFLKSQEATLSKVEDLVARAKVLAIQAANATQDINARKAAAEEIDRIVQNLLSLANSQLGEKYLFSGQKTTGFPPGETPFKLVKETLPDGQILEKVLYQGSTEDFEIGYDKDMKMTLGENGQKVFMDSGVFETLLALKRLLLADNKIDYQKEQYSIQEIIGKLDEIYNHFAGKRGKIGAEMSHLETKKNLYLDFKQTLESNLSEVESADLAKLATRLQSLQIAYEAALKATALFSDMSLAKYL